MSDESVPSGEIVSISGANASKPGNFSPLDFAKARANAVTLPEQQIAQSDKALEELSRADVNALTNETGKLAC